MTVLGGGVIRPSGDAAVVLEYGDVIDPDVHERVLAADEAIGAAEVPGVEELVPSYRSLLVRLDPLVTTPEAVVAHLRTLSPRGGVEERRTVEVVVDFGRGEDLEVVAQRTATTPGTVVGLLTGSDLRVYLHGFAPGFAYLGGVPDSLQLPRRSTPRAPVPAGSVLLAAGQAALCPTSMPTGWWVVGHTDQMLFDPEQDPPVPFRPGDHVRMVAAS